NHLTFGKQPTSTLVNSAITPAGSVRVVDPFNNLVTGDSTDQVTIALGANPGLAVLGGTATLTVSGGVAQFSNLTLSAAGTGYTLTARSGTSTALSAATSTSFNIVAASAAGVIVDFESGNLGGWRGVGGNGSVT